MGFAACYTDLAAWSVRAAHDLAPTHELTCASEHWRLHHPAWSGGVTVNHKRKASVREQHRVHALLGRLLARRRARGLLWSQANRHGMKAARTEQSEEAREANRRRMKAAREEQSDEAREAAREADKRGKQAARAEQSDEARKAAREENKRGKKEARERGS